MKYKFTLTILLMCIIKTSIAQTVNVTYTDEFEKNKTKAPYHPLGKNYYTYNINYKTKVKFFGKNDKFNLNHSIEFIS